MTPEQVLVYSSLHRNQFESTLVARYIYGWVKNNQQYHWVTLADDQETMGKLVWAYKKTNKPTIGSLIRHLEGELGDYSGLVAITCDPDDGIKALVDHYSKCGKLLVNKVFR